MPIRNYRRPWSMASIAEGVESSSKLKSTSLSFFSDCIYPVSENIRICTYVLNTKPKWFDGIKYIGILSFSCSGFNFTSYLIIVTFNMFSRVIPRLACIANGKNWQKKLPTTQSLLTRSINVNMSSL